MGSVGGRSKVRTVLRRADLKVGDTAYIETSRVGRGLPSYEEVRVTRITATQITTSSKSGMTERWLKSSGDNIGSSGKLRGTFRTLVTYREED